MSPKPLTIGAIDAGSNAIRVSICSALGPTDFSALVTERVPVRLGHHTFTHHELAAETIESAVAAFSRFRKLFDQYGVDHYRAVATSAVRNARNRETLLHRLYHETQIELEVIDGREEARLVRRAVENACGARLKPDAIIDLGGGSLEVSKRTSNGWDTASMRIGTVRLIETFGVDGTISQEEATLLGRYVSSLLGLSIPRDSFGEHGQGIACGGNAEALARLFGKPDAELGMHVLERDVLERVLPKILRANIDKRMAKYGVRRDRAEVMAVAGLVFATAMRDLKLDRIVVPGVGLREGVLLELARSRLGEVEIGGRTSDHALMGACRSFAARIGHNISHGSQVRRVAIMLFDQLNDVHGIGREQRIVLEVAALLHDVGEVIHRRGHNKHGEYLIRNGRIPRLQDDVRNMVAALVRGHRKSLPSKRHLTYGELAAPQRHIVQNFAPILRLADALDTDHRQRVHSVEATVDHDRKRVVIQAMVERVMDGTGSPHLARRKLEAFKSVYGYDVDIDVVAVPASERLRPLRTE